MAFTNQQANSNDRVSVNTRGLQFYNTEGFEPSTLVLNYWNDNMFSIKIHPAKEQSKQTEREKFDYEKSTSSALSITKAEELLSHVGEVIEAHQKGEECSFYVCIAGVHLMGIGTKNIGDRNVIFFAIHKELNNERIPAESAYFEFNASECITQYDPATGKFEMGNAAPAEFNLFVKYLGTGINAMTKATAHSIRVVNHFYSKRIEDKIDSLMAANGVEYSGNNGGSRYRNGGGRSLFGGSSNANATDNRADAEVTNASTAGSLDEEIPF